VGKKDYIFSTQMSMFGKREIIGFGSDDFYIQEMDKELSNEMIIKNHYSHKVAGFATTYIYLGLYINRELLGTLQFGFAMNPASAKNIVKDTGIYEHLELNRMWMDDKAGRNTESMALSYSIKYIRAKHKKINWIQSFADERCGGFGIVYQAANFKYYGEHSSDFYSLDGEYVHKIALTHHADKRPLYEKLRARKDEMVKESLRQFRYIYFINQRSIKDCLLTEKPCPKHYAGGAILNVNTSTTP
jgi:hypothetical protein